MARKIRVFIENAPNHIFIKSLEEIELFKDNDDYTFFQTTIIELSQRLNLKIHSYAIAQNYIELLATPQTVETIPKFMQVLGRQYVVYYNKKYNRSGTLWDGRYKSSIVEAEAYLFNVMSYIENKQDTLYSSKDKNLQGNEDQIVTTHQLYENLGKTQDERSKAYTKKFSNQEDNIEFIENCLTKQLITGTEKYIKTLEQELGLAIMRKKRGRPKKVTNKNSIYKNLQVLDKNKHKDLKINPLNSLEFAKNLTFVPIVSKEIVLVGAVFPIVFINKEDIALASLVSIGGENLGIDENGKWLISYVPTFLRKYPFVLASAKENQEQKIVLIDEDSSLFSKEEGKPLFEENGEQSETLKNSMKFLTQIEQQNLITKNLIEEINNSGILEDREITIGEGEEKKTLVSGFKVVNKKRLDHLDNNLLESWEKKGILSFINIHLKSLENINLLFELASKRQK